MCSGFSLLLYILSDFLSLLGVNQSLFKDTVHCYSWSEQQ